MSTGLLLPLLAVVIFVVGARHQPSRSTGLSTIPDRLFKQNEIDAKELGPAVAATKLMASWRRRGALIGALSMAVPVVVVRDSLPLSLVAILAGAASGLAAAQWWQTSRPTGAVRVASLERRTVIGLVGATPLVLLALMLTAAVGASVAWLAERTHTGDTVLVAGHRTCFFHLFTPPLSGPAIGWVGALLATLTAAVAAAATARRGADAVLAQLPTSRCVKRQSAQRSAAPSPSPHRWRRGCCSCCAACWTAG